MDRTELAPSSFTRAQRALEDISDDEDNGIVTTFRATITSDEPLRFPYVQEDSISTLVLSVASFRPSSAAQASSLSTSSKSRKRGRDDGKDAPSPVGPVSFLQVRPGDDDVAANSTDRERTWWCIAAFPNQDVDRPFTVAHLNGLRLEIDSQLEVRLLGPGSVTLMGEQFSILSREDRDHGMFDDDEHDAFGDDEEDDDDDDEDFDEDIVFD